VHLANDPGCICGCALEDAIHYILECCLYNEAREELKLRLVFLNELKIEVLLFGAVSNRINIKDYHYYVFCRTSLIFYYVYENGGVPTQFQNIGIQCLHILASGQLSMLRKFKIKLNRENLEEIYFTYIRPLLEYAC
jgi:hypothetical protein